MEVYLFVKLKGEINNLSRDNKTINFSPVTLLFFVNRCWTYPRDIGQTSSSSLWQLHYQRRSPDWSKFNSFLDKINNTKKQYYNLNNMITPIFLNAHPFKPSWSLSWLSNFTLFIVEKLLEHLNNIFVVVLHHLTLFIG